MKNYTEPVVALAGWELEWPGNGLAGMGPVKHAEFHLQQKHTENCKYMHTKYEIIC